MRGLTKRKFSIPFCVFNSCDYFFAVVVASVYCGEADLNSKRIFGLIVNRDRRGRNSFTANSMVYGSKAKQLDGRRAIAFSNEHFNLAAINFAFAARRLIKYTQRLRIGLHNSIRVTPV